MVGNKEGEVGGRELSGSEDILGYSQPPLPPVLNLPSHGEIIPQDIKEPILQEHLLPVYIVPYWLKKRFGHHANN